MSTFIVLLCVICDNGKYYSSGYTVTKLIMLTGGLKMQDWKMEDQKMEDQKLQDQVLAWKMQE